MSIMRTIVADLVLHFPSSISAHPSNCHRDWFDTTGPSALHVHLCTERLSASIFSAPAPLCVHDRKCTSNVDRQTRSAGNLPEYGQANGVRWWERERERERERDCRV